MKSKMPKFICNAKKSLSKHSPKILTCMGVSGMVLTTVLAVKATPKAMSIINDKKDLENKEKLSSVEIICETWKCYIPTMIMGITSISCIIGASSINHKRNAVLAAAYTLSESTLKEYRDKVVETVGEKKEKQVRDLVAKEKIKKDPVVSKEVIITNSGNTLCYEPITGRYFYSDINKIKSAVIEINRKMIDEMYATLNDFYYEIGLDETTMGDELGWSIDNRLDVGFSSQIASNGTPCLVIDYYIPPKYDFHRYY